MKGGADNPYSPTSFPGLFPSTENEFAYCREKLTIISIRRFIRKKKLRFGIFYCEKKKVEEVVLNCGEKKLHGVITATVRRNIMKPLLV